MTTQQDKSQPIEHSKRWRWFQRLGETIVPGLSLPLLRRIAPYARPYLRLEILLLVLLVSNVTLDLLHPLLVRAIIDQAILPGDAFLLNVLALGLIVIPLVRGGLNAAQTYLAAYIGEGIVRDLRQELYAHLEKMSLRFFVNTSIGEIMSRLDDVTGAKDIFTQTLVSILTNVITVVAALGVMFAIEWRLTLLSLLLVPFFIIPTRWAARRSRQLTRETQQLSRTMSQITSQTLNVSGALLVKVFGRQDYEAQRFAEQTAKICGISVRRAVVWQILTLGLTLAGAVGVALAYLFGGHMVLGQVLTIGTLMAFTGYLWRVYGPLSRLMDVPVNLASAFASLERLFQTLDLPAEITDRPDARVIHRTQGHIRFEHVYFCYGGPPPPDKPQVERDWAIEDVSLEIEPGELAAFVGPSGSGKTTLTYLLPRLYDTMNGAVTIDGIDVRDLQLASLAEQIGVVAQETYLFDDTIRANLLYARPQATQSELEAAIEAVYLAEVIAQLPNGLDTVVGQRGYRMSGGERQRLSIARAILKDPRILILDEATSALDTESEMAVQAALERLFEDRTSLVIAHRLSTIRSADVIFALEDGRLAEQGTHAQLLAKDGLYARLYRKQFKDQIVLDGLTPAEILAFPPAERELLLALLRLRQATPQAIARATKHLLRTIAPILTKLEEEGHIRLLEDGRYELVLAQARPSQTPVYDKED